MKIAAKVSPFLGEYKDLEEALKALKNTGIKYIHLTYPNDLKGYSVEEIRKLISEYELVVGGIDIVLDDVSYLNGAFVSIDSDIYESAIDNCVKGIDVCKQLGCDNVSIWSTYDGFDYPFQTNYANAWDQIVEAYRKLSNYDETVSVGIEYKPYQPQAFSMVDSMGIVGLILSEVSSSNLGVTVNYNHSLMKHENPAFPIALFGSRDQLVAVKISDGYGLNKDSLMSGTISPLQTLEYLYYLKKYNFDRPIVIDTQAVREDVEVELMQNIKMITKMVEFIDSKGLDEIQRMVDNSDAIEITDFMMEMYKE